MNFVNVLQKTQEKYPIHIILMGDKTNTEQYGNLFLQFFGKCNVSNLIGHTSLRETIELLKCCDLYLGCDTGPMHLAAACGLPGIVLFFAPVGTTETVKGIFPPERFGPWQSEMRILRPMALAECEKRGINSIPHCINQIRTDDVIRELMDLLEKESDKFRRGGEK